MTLFKECGMEQAFAKVGIFGKAGAGKTLTSMKIAIGIIKMLKAAGLPCKNAIYFVETETGSDYVKHLAEEAGIKFHVAKTRAFSDLVPLVAEIEAGGDVGIFDSITHFWVDVVDSYRRKKAEKYRTNLASLDLAFQDWGVIKPEWAKFTDAYIAANAHLILCGRSGNEWDYFENEKGKMELYKTGTKMKTEGETAYEPSLLIEMERISNPESVDAFREAKDKKTKALAAKAMAENRAFVRRCYVLKDRSDRLDGKIFDNPTFDDFAPHWEFLNLGGKQTSVDTTRTSDKHFNLGGESYGESKKRTTILLEEIEGEITMLWPGTDKFDKAAKRAVIFCAFGTHSWTAVKDMSESQLHSALETLREVKGGLDVVDKADDAEAYVKALWQHAKSVVDGSLIQDASAGSVGQELGAADPASALKACMDIISDLNSQAPEDAQIDALAECGLKSIGSIETTKDADRLIAALEKRINANK